MNEGNRESVKFKIENESPATKNLLSGTKMATQTSSIKKEHTTNASSDTSKVNGVGTTQATNSNNINDDADRRMRAETVKKNWKIVLDMAMKKRTDGDYFDRSESVALNSFNSSLPPSHEIYASEKENWIYFSIIIATVVFLSILFCYLVYSFFPSFRSHNF